MPRGLGIGSLSGDEGGRGRSLQQPLRASQLSLSDPGVGISKCWGFVDLSHYMKQFILLWVSSSSNVQGAMSLRAGG